MAFVTNIDVEKKLPVINGFVAIPDGQILLPTKLTPLDVLSLIPGSTLIRLGSNSAIAEISVLDPTASSINGRSRKQGRLFIRLPRYDRLEGAPEDWFAILRAAAQ